MVLLCWTFILLNWKIKRFSQNYHVLIYFRWITVRRHFMRKSFLNLIQFMKNLNICLKCFVNKSKKSHFNSFLKMQHYNNSSSHNWSMFRLFRLFVQTTATTATKKTAFILPFNKWIGVKIVWTNIIIYIDFENHSFMPRVEGAVFRLCICNLNKILCNFRLMRIWNR